MDFKPKKEEAVWQYMQVTILNTSQGSFLFIFTKTLEVDIIIISAHCTNKESETRELNHLAADLVPGTQKAQFVLPSTCYSASGRH